MFTKSLRTWSYSCQNQPFVSPIVSEEVLLIPSESSQNQQISLNCRFVGRVFVSINSRQPSLNPGRGSWQSQPRISYSFFS